MLLSQHVLLIVEIGLHVGLFHDVCLLHGRDVSFVLFNQSGDLGAQLINLVAGIGS